MSRPSSRARRLGAALTAAAVSVLGLLAAPASAGAAASAPSAPAVSAVTPTAPGSVVPLPPARVMDTRTGTNVRPGVVAAGTSVTLSVLGKGGVPTTGVAAVVLNVTVVGASQPGYLTVYPGGTTPPPASNLNYATALPVPNLVLAKLGAGGTVAFRASTSTHVLADVVGYVVAGAPTTPGAVVPVAPQRVMDTRTGVGVRRGQVPAGGTVALPVLGAPGLPTRGVAAVLLNVTVADPVGGGYLTVHPDGTATPTASNVNYVAHQTVPNLVLAKVGAGGRVDFSAVGSATDVVADVAGYVVSGVATQPGAVVPTAPARVLDTRTGLGARPGPVPAGGAVALPVLGRGGVPSTGVSAVVLNVTVTAPTGPGYLTVYPGATTRPPASNLNFVAGQTVPNLVVVPVGADGTVALGAVGSSTQVVADVAGFVLRDPRTPPGPVTGLATTPAATAVTLAWTVAGSSTGTVVRRAVGTTPPATADDGTLVADLAVPAATVTDRGLTPSTTYSYAVFSHGEGQLYGAAATATTTTAAPDGLGTLTGTVTDAAGSHHGLAGVTVTVSSRTTGVTRSATTGPTGTWVLDGLTPGRDYSACFTGWNATGGSSDALGYVYRCYRDLDAGNLVVPANGTTSGVDAALLAGGSVGGTVSQAAGTHPGVAGVRVTVSSYALQSRSGQPTVTTGTDGRYLVRGLATESGYEVCFDPTGVTGGTAGAAGYAQQCWDHQPSSSPTPLPVRAGTARTGIDGSLGVGGAVSGTVREAGTLRPLAGARVQVSLGSRPVASAVTAADGGYRVADLGAGPGYVVHVDAPDATGGSSDASGYLSTFLGGAVAGSATPLTVTAGTTLTGRDVVLSPAGAISGQVTDQAATRHGLRGVAVFVRSSAAGYDGSSYAFTTDATGRYRLAGLKPAADYQVCFRTEGTVVGGASDATGYQPECWDGVRADGTPTPVTVTAGAVSTASADLAAGAAVTGRVTDAGGTHAPLGGVRVTAAPLSGAFGYVDGVLTAADGTYTLRNLSPAGGPYAVCFEGATAYGGSSDTNAYTGQCWKNVSSAGTPTRVPVTAGGTVPGISAALTAAGGITGTVTEKAGTHHALAGVFVTAQSSMTTNGYGFGSATTGADGSYRLVGLPPGAYTVCLQPRVGATGGGASDAIGYAATCYLDQPTSATATPVVVRAAQASTANQSLAAAGRVTGTVTQDGGTRHALAGVQVTVSSQSAQAYGSATTDASGRFSVPGLAPAADYVVCYDGAQATGGTSDTYGYARECWNNAADEAHATKVAVTSGATATLDAALPAPTGIAGVVTEDGGAHAGLAGVAVTVHSDSAGTYGYATTDAQGRYSFGSLVPAADYQVCFDTGSGVSGGSQDAQGYVGECWRDATLSNPTPVTVTSRTVTTVAVALADGGAVSGTVTDASGAPLSSVGVMVGDPADGQLTMVWTADDGTWTAQGVPAGTDRTVCFSASGASGGSSTSGYVDECWDDVASNGTATPVTVTTGRTTTGVSARLAAAATVSGRVTAAATGSPVEGVDVELHQGGSTDVVAYASSAADGTYTFPGLAASSDYRVCFVAGFAGPYADQCWDGAPYDVTLATPVAVTGGSRRTGVDARLAAS
ncbi:beta strand repeat-containing protein [Lapillicoccus jejuensis]|uniref:alpha-amylase n=1 Tax=Lapillicoccus jejuensis TaxID=402171 RepID=A0A542E249_9MICO|nr:carboxypeptidase regulatory-like domain-containing protein [Lapillicoccus jejuensis]TQJ09385.1 carboxypeptidase family protein [Lapillicoccus jejuensis]